MERMERGYGGMSLPDRDKLTRDLRSWLPGIAYAAGDPDGIRLIVGEGERWYIGDELFEYRDGTWHPVT